MTLQATRKGHKITVHTTYGPVDNHVTEHWRHVKGFRDQLSTLLDEAEAEEKADHETVPDRRAAENTLCRAAGIAPGPIGS